MTARRSGVTLVEVLVSIFVMGIGLLALLVLFPLGALNMAQAIRSDRCGHIAQNATAFAHFWPHGDGSAVTGIRDDTYVTQFPVNGKSAYQAPPDLPDLTTIPNGYAGSSYPVYIDPLGFLLGSRKLGELPPGISGQVTGFARAPLYSLYHIPYNAATLPANPRMDQLVRWFTLLDDVGFSEDGTADLPTGSLGGHDVKREGRYSWAFLTKLDDYTKAPGSLANLSVVVYDRRQLLSPSTGVSNVTDPGTGEMPGEKSYEAYTDTLPGGATIAKNVIVLVWNQTATVQEAPAIRKGGWVFDATVEGPNTSQESIHGYFYRVVAVTNPGSLGPNSADLEIQTDRKKNLNKGVVVVMENVVEVFDRGTN